MATCLDREEPEEDNPLQGGARRVGEDVKAVWGQGYFCGCRFLRMRSSIQNANRSLSFDHAALSSPPLSISYAYDPTFSSCRPVSSIPSQGPADNRYTVATRSQCPSFLAWCDEAITQFRPNQSICIVHTLLLYDQTTSPLPLSRFLISLSMTCSG